jgi:Na+/H+ antiporter NhaD/arsenite permease-like protein
MNYIQPSPLMVLPFILFLLMIATGPLYYKHFWDRNYAKVSILLGLLISVYYIFFLRDYHSVIHAAGEYISFIALLSSLYVASSGIYIKVNKKATPLVNIAFLFIGAVLSNIIGTVGASMLLIRPFIKLNNGRIKPYHIIFFIFIVSNVGGALTPIGNPPLFLGFLLGVPFFWVISNLWYIWLPSVVLILLVFYFFDKRNLVEPDSKIEYSNKIEFKGIKNLILLVIILVSVFIDPNVISYVPSFKPFPFGIREIIMFCIIYLAYKKVDVEILKANDFSFEPVKEVAYLFFGIFLAMIPVLQLIANNAHVYSGSLNQGTFYWASGSLSSFLDNAPTYLIFLGAAMGKSGLNVNNPQDVLQLAQVNGLYLKAISVGAVFFGAVTYIGNSPNFIVKSISERAGVKMPSFHTYLFKYAIPILIPVFTLVWLIFFR